MSESRVSKGVVRIESPVFHFPRYADNGLSDHYKPHLAVDHGPGGPSLTRQEFAEECDVNTIMERYEHTGVLPAGGEAFYYDFTSLPTSMMESMDVMRNATEAFMTLPAKVRREFENDAASFVDFASDPENLPQMRTWGLAPEAPVEPPKAAPAVPMTDLVPVKPSASPSPAPAPAAPTVT